MTKVSEINRAFEEHFNKVEGVAREAQVKAVRKAYLYIMDSWPVFTGFSKANNRISITGRTVARMEPSTRPEGERALEGKAEAIKMSQLAKLDRLPLESKNRVVVIGNSVSYAADVSFEPGRGRQIYEEARQIADSILTREHRRKR